MDLELSHQLSSLVEKATKANTLNVDLQIMKAIKNIARQSNSYVKVAHDVLLQQLEANSSQVIEDNIPRY